MSRKLFCILLSLLLYSSFASAQDAEENAGYARQYLDSRTGSLDQYLHRSGKVQQRLLKRLKRKETKLLRKLAAKDSALYYRYKSQGMDYDSIAALLKDTGALQRLSARKNSITDSLRGVQRFLAGQAGKLNAAGDLAGKVPAAGDYTGKLDQLQQQLNGQQKIDELIRQHTASLETMVAGNKLSGIQGIQKQVYYAREKIKAFKSMADDPDEAEEEALEYLQGTEGFAGSFNSSSQAFGGLGNNATAEDLQRLGYQTKSQVNAMLQQKLGNNLGPVQQQMATQVQAYQEKLNSVTGKIEEAKQSIGEGKQALQEARQTKEQLKHLEKPAFKKNPERGKPFWQRLETQYNFQTSRATPDGLRPAMLELGGSVAFKHTPRLSYGIGLAWSAGLGQRWQDIRFTYEGITARAFADWRWQYGFSLQAGYERAFRPANRAYLPAEADKTGPDPGTAGQDNALQKAFGGQQQAAYIGIMKRYRVNSKWSGTFLAGYNFLWQQEGLRSPFLLRFGWGK